MTRDQLVAYWVESADEDLQAMESLYQTGHHSWALFLGHLVLEKLLKALYAKRVDSEIPRVHDLVVLARRAGVALTGQREELLEVVHSVQHRGAISGLQEPIPEESHGRVHLPSPGADSGGPNMAAQSDQELIHETIRAYVQRLREHGVPVWRVYLFGSCAKGSHRADSDIDVAVFLDQEDIDGFEEGVLLSRLRRGIDDRIEPHAFARTDVEDQDPMVREILRTGERVA